MDNVLSISQNEMEQRFEQLPDEVVEELLSSKTADRVNNLARQYQLTPEQTEVLSITVSLVYFGDIAVSEFGTTVRFSI